MSECGHTPEEHAAIMGLTPSVTADYDQIKASQDEALTLLLDEWRRIRAQGDVMEIDAAVTISALVVLHREQLAWLVLVAVQRLDKLTGDSDGKHD